MRRWLLLALLVSGCATPSHKDAWFMIPSCGSATAHRERYCWDANHHSVTERYSVKFFPNPKVEFLMLREGLCRVGSVTQTGDQFLLSDLHEIPCPVEELKTYR